MQEHARFTFGPFELDVGERGVRRAGEPVRLTPKTVEVLIALVERRGAIVNKEWLLDRVWHGICVEECNLAQHVATLRRVFGDNAREPAYIETIPRRGYRFVAPVARSTGPLDDPSPDPPAPSAPAEEPVALEATPPEAPTVDPAPIVLDEPRRAPGLLRRFAPAAAGIAVALVAAALASTRPWSSERPIRSLAILPVTNLTGDTRHDRLAAALTDVLRRDLVTLVPRVADGGGPGRLGHPLPPGTSRHAAGVDAAVECAVLSAGDRVRVVAELLDAETDLLIWADVFEAEPVAFLELEAKVVEALRSRLLRRIPAEADRARAARATARREYEVARMYLGGRTPEVLTECLEHFEAAIALDPDLAPAHAGLAEAYLLAAEERVLPASIFLEKASAEVHRALLLDPQLAEAHVTLAGIVEAQWDFSAAEQGYRQAIALDPSLTIAHQRYAGLLTILDRHPEAIAEARAALDLEPRSPSASLALAAAYLGAGRLPESIGQATATLKLAPKLPAAYGVLGRAFEASGHRSEAVRALEQAVLHSDRSPVYVSALARIQARANGSTSARALLEELERSRASPIDVALVLEALGDCDAAIETLEKAAEDGVPWLLPPDAGPVLSELHDHPRFVALVEWVRQRPRPVLHVDQ